MEELDLMIDPYAELEHLRKLATADPAKRFGKLLKIVRQEAFLEIAWQRVRPNKGSQTPGVDGQIKDDIDAEVIHDLAQELAEKCYQPQPVRRVYIPKGKNQRRPLGIPTLRDRIVQAAVMMVLEAIYEPIFRDCSHGFRPGRSTVSALRHVARAYRSGATWIIEGDLQKCFDSLPHGVILNCLRKRIKDERFIDLIRRMLQAGVMEDFRYKQTYSGAPQGGIVSPILMNVVLHEFDGWMEDHWGANPSPLTPRQQWARTNPEYARIKRNLCRWRAQLAGRIPMGRQTVEGLKRKIKESVKERKQVPSALPRQVIYYCRYADDYLVVMCNYSKEDARCLKQAMAEWLQATLGVIQHPEKTQITHWSERYRFLGYHLRGQRNPNGTRWLRLTIPPEAERHLKQRLKRLCGWTQIPETDLFMSVNALLRGWTQYYRYAHNATQRFGYLTGVVFWLVAHYLGRKHRRSIKKLMRSHYGVDPKTGKRALYTIRPNDTRLFIWNKPPQRQSVLAQKVYVKDRRPVMMTAWAGGHSYEQKLEMQQQAGNRCQHCGRPSPKLIVHHPNRLGKRPHHKQGPANVIQSAQEQQAKLLCPDCHLQHHPGGWHDAGVT
jgi:group II intron reverse transcriptase/maturase